jgi:lipid-A-disaccharide synthase-like uncharacterized protein
LDWEAIVGLIGVATSQAAGLTQILRLLKTKTAHDVSLLTFVFLISGALVMLLYFIANPDIVGLAFNSLSLVMDITILVMILAYRRRI